MQSDRHIAFCITHSFLCAEKITAGRSWLPSASTAPVSHCDFDTSIFSSSFLWVPFPDIILCVINKVDEMKPKRKRTSPQFSVIFFSVIFSSVWPSSSYVFFLLIDWNITQGPKNINLERKVYWMHQQI